MIRIVLVDDHEIIRDGLKALLYSDSRLKIVGECSDGDEVVGFLNETPADVVLMDINMPRMNGIQATEAVVGAFPDTNVIALTMHNEDSYIQKVLKAGASGYVLKNSGQEGLVNAIVKVHEEGTFFTQEVASIMMSKYLKKNGQKPQTNVLVSLDDLTKREMEILRLIAEELTNNEIAKKLFISPRTVDTHRRNLLQKLQVKNTAGLVKFAISSGLCE